MKLEEMMGRAQNVIIHCEDEVVITWDRKRLLRAWGQVEPGEYRELSVQTLEDIPDSIDAAMLRGAMFFYGRKLPEDQRPL